MRWMETSEDEPETSEDEVRWMQWRRSPSYERLAMRQPPPKFSPSPPSYKRYSALMTVRLSF